MNEAQLTTEFGHWVAAHRDELPPFVFEAKIVKLDKKRSLALSSFQEHQLPFLRQASSIGVYYKHPDLGNRTPGDGFFFYGKAYVVIYWYIPRRLKLCTMIDINVFDHFISQAQKKSIRQEEAEDIADYVFNL